MRDTHVALLRGINVGGKNLVPMRELAALFAGAGCIDVSTFIQSGNVIFNADPKLAARLAGALEQRIEEKFGFAVPVILRSARDLAAVVRANPFADGADPESATATVMVMFLAGKPTAAGVAALDPDRSPPDEFVLRGREIYLRCPNGFGRSKLTNAYFDGKLATTSTGRNWRTVLKLAELTGAAR